MTCNLSYHQTRFDRSRKALFGSTRSLDLASFIEPPSEGLYRCRILYNEHIRSIEYFPYTPKEIHRLKIVTSNIQYDYKYADRKGLNSLLSKEDNMDEIIIEKEGYLTDTTIANIAFYDGEQWFTPARPLLEGTMRAKLLAKSFLQKKDIAKEELKNYTHVALMNAMIGFKILKHFTIQK